MPLLGFLVRMPPPVQGERRPTWYVQTVIDRRSVLATLRSEGVAAVNTDKVSAGEAEVLKIADYSQVIGGSPAVDRQAALKSKTGPFGPSPSPTAWLRKCPSCGRTPTISRSQLYQRADRAAELGEDTVSLTP